MFTVHFQIPECTMWSYLSPTPPPYAITLCAVCMCKNNDTVHLQCFCVLFICNLITTNLWPAPAPLIAWHCKSQYLLHLAGQPNTVASPCNMRPQITFPGHQVCSIKSVPSNLPLKQHPLLAHTICYTWTPL